jgi:hypothetical protein
VPPPASEPTVWLKPLRPSVAPATLASVTAELRPKAWPPVAAPAESVPPLTVVAPV